MKAKAGSLLSFETGEYSDYGVTGFFVVLQAFDPQVELTAYLWSNPKQNEEYNFESEQFLQFLLSKGYLLEIEYSVLYTDGYGTPKVEFRKNDSARTET